MEQHFPEMKTVIVKGLVRLEDSTATGAECPDQEEEWEVNLED